MPIFYAVAHAYVLRALYGHVVSRFVDSKADPRVRHAYATVFKVASMRRCEALHIELSERCGAQGLFTHNQIVSQLVRAISNSSICESSLKGHLQSDIRGIVIAEGDTLVISIREWRTSAEWRVDQLSVIGLASELLLGRYTLPRATHPNGLLAKHEVAIFTECREVVQTHGHRSEAFASLVLPRCTALVEAIGARMAYEAALEEGVPEPLVELYVCGAIKGDLAWYVEKGLLSRSSFGDRESRAFESALPLMEAFVDKMGVEPYVHAPIVSDEMWGEFLRGLRVYKPYMSA